jgi:carboxymethylenebutenolidase
MTSTEELVANARPTTAYVADAASGDAPGVVLYHAWWGLNDDVRAFADRLAESGFFVVAPDLYRGSSTAEIEEAKRLTRSVDEADADAIALAVIDRLADRRNATGRIGAVGFSFGAHWSMWSAAQRDIVAASVVYYGTTGGPFLAEAEVPVQGHFAADDPFEGPEDVAAFEGALRAAGREVTIHTYPGTGHWFAEPSRDAFRPEAADQAFERTIAFLHANLPTRTSVEGTPR